MRVPRAGKLRGGLQAGSHQYKQRRSGGSRLGEVRGMRAVRESLSAESDQAHSA